MTHRAIRSYRFAKSLTVDGAGKCTQHSARSAEMKPLTGRNLTVIRSMHYEVSADVAYRTSFERDPIYHYRVSFR